MRRNEVAVKAGLGGETIRLSDGLRADIQAV